MFPSPQGGSETIGFSFNWKGLTLFPSPQGGSETGNLNWSFNMRTGRFPSPQGGSETDCLQKFGILNVSFHPLKAGRRPSDMCVILVCQKRFHPLKAGRRQNGFDLQVYVNAEFPSPQGGSETDTD